MMNQLLPGAEAAAEADGAEGATAEYLVVAALDMPDGTAREAFELIGADPNLYRQAIRDQHQAALRSAGIRGIDDDALDHLIPDPVPPRGPLKSTPSAQRLFRDVVAHVRNDRSQLYGAYVVLAAAEGGEGTARRSIEQMGINPEDLADAARQVLAQSVENPKR